MRVYPLTASLTLCLLMLLVFLLVQNVQGQNYFEYDIQLRRDGSAVWTITYFSSANATIETFDVFQQKIFNLVDSAASVTHRELAVDENSLQIDTIRSLDSKTTEYTFVWQNFSVVQDSELSFGDVFQVNNFFGVLYGDAAMHLTFPPDFTVKSVFPVPNSGQDSGLIKWSRTQDLVTNRVNVVLTSNSQDGNNSSNGWQLYAIVIAALAIAVILAVLGFFMFKIRKNNASLAISAESPLLSEEDKVIKLLKSSGGSMRQSEITDQLRFSKAKTSQLLAALEKRSSITRYKNGRDKIVTLKERVKGE